MTSKPTPTDWPAVINESGLTNTDLARQLDEYGYKFSISAVQMLRSGETRQPRHDVGQAIIALCRQAKRRAQKHPQLSRTR